jgi:hypothetical protein
MNWARHLRWVKWLSPLCHHITKAQTCIQLWKHSLVSCLWLSTILLSSVLPVDASCRGIFPNEGGIYKPASRSANKLLSLFLLLHHLNCRSKRAQSTHEDALGLHRGYHIDPRATADAGRWARTSDWVVPRVLTTANLVETAEIRGKQYAYSCARENKKIGMLIWILFQSSSWALFHAFAVA